MKKLVLSIIFTVIAGVGVGMVAWADDPMSKKEAKPDLKERLFKDSVKGTLMKTEGEYYWIKDDDGKETKIHVDMSTKMDKVIVGDKVKAFLTEKGHATTLQRLEK
jgi:uncharacterized protein YpmB